MPPLQDVLTIDQPSQLKALGHPLRLRVLETLGANEEPLTNRELAARLSVDPGHLHFHVKMLLQAGLIERANGGQRREKPYQAIAKRVRVAPELLASGAANDVRAAMLEDVQEGWARFAPAGDFRSAQMLITIKPEHVRELWNAMVEKAKEYEDDDVPPQLLTFFAHPHIADL